MSGVLYIPIYFLIGSIVGAVYYVVVKKWVSRDHEPPDPEECGFAMFFWPGTVFLGFVVIACLGMVKVRDFLLWVVGVKE